MNQHDETDQEIGDDDSEDTGESTLSSDIEGDDLDYQQDVLHLGQPHQNKSFCTERVPLPKNRAVPILALHTLCFEIAEIYLLQWHHHCSNTKSHPSSTNYPSLTMYDSPGHWYFPTSLAETRIFHNPRPVVIKMFPNTKRLHLR